MKRVQNLIKSRKSLVILMGFAIILLAAYLNYLDPNSKLFENRQKNIFPVPSNLSQPYSPTPKIFLTENESGLKTYYGKSVYSSYNNGKFTMEFPRGCDSDSKETEIVKCPGFEINPQAGGRGAGAAKIISSEDVILGNYQWKRNIWVVEGYSSATVTYTSEINNVSQFIEVRYDNYSNNLQNEVEKIIATFKSIE